MFRLRASLFAVALFALPIVAYATGFGSDSPPSRIPVPAKDFSAVVEDHGGVVVEVTRVSYNGEVFLYGKLGAAQLTVPFDSLASVEFFAAPEKDRRRAHAITKDGQSIDLLVDDDTLCYGKTRFGNYSIEVERIRSIRFK